MFLLNDVSGETVIFAQVISMIGAVSFPGIRSIRCTEFALCRSCLQSRTNWP